jgi:putative flippase GtrA
MVSKPATARGQLLRSAGVSLVAFSADFGLLALLTEVGGLHYLFSAGISFLVGTAISYALSVLWVFERRRISSRALELAIFVLVGVVGLGLNEALLWALTDLLGIYYLASKILAASLIFFWNFAARRYVLFR